MVEAKMSGDDLWFVKLPNGDVHHVTIDQLDTAFEAGHIDANTLVLAEGSTQWTRLGEAAGLDEAPAPAPTPAVVYSPTPGPVTMPPLQTVAVAPVARAAYAPPAASRPQPAYRPYATPATPAGSIRPMAMDLGSDLDFDDMPFKKSGSRTGWVVAVLSLALVGGGTGYAATHGIALGGIGGGSSTVSAAAMVAPPPVAPEPAPAPPAPAPLPQVQAPLAGTLPAVESGLNPRFTQAQKEKLLQADKVHDDQAKSRQSSHYSPHAKYKSSSTFTKGGNKFDPLNSDL
jgi:hypothetical protein